MSELKLPELFGSRVFNEETMKERLSGACYQAWNGIGSYEKPLQEMNVICAIYSSYYQHVVRKDRKSVV